MYSFDVDKGVFSTHFDIIIVNMISQSFWYPWGNCYASKQQVCSHVSCCQVLVFASLWFHSFFYIYMEKGKIVYNFKKTFQTEKAFPNIQSLSARQVKEAWVYNEETCDTSISKNHHFILNNFLFSYWCLCPSCSWWGCVFFPEVVSVSQGENNSNQMQNISLRSSAMHK